MQSEVRSLGDFAASVPPLKVLVVEDEEGTRRSLGAAVRSLGHDYRSAPDGQEAWDAYQRERADVIVSEWHLPKMDGLELCRRAHETSDKDAYTYFLLMTPFTEKESFVRGAQAGVDDFLKKPIDADELHARLLAAGRVLGAYRELAEMNARLRRDSQTAFHVARVDALTSVGNRRAMDEDLIAMWARATRYGHRYSLAICDIDRFKEYNDELGHVAGDEALRTVAEMLARALRSGDALYRYGGEEFVVLLPEQPLALAARAMDRIRAAVEKRAIPMHEERDVLTISVGVAGLDSSVDRAPSDWLRRADAALYRAKALGRNRVETQTPLPNRPAPGGASPDARARSG